jgi:hypothetical protein
MAGSFDTISSHDLLSSTVRVKCNRHSAFDDCSSARYLLTQVDIERSYLREPAGRAFVRSAHGARGERSDHVGAASFHDRPGMRTPNALDSLAAATTISADIGLLISERSISNWNSGWGVSLGVSRGAGKREMPRSSSAREQDREDHSVATNIAYPRLWGTKSPNPVHRHVNPLRVALVI